MTELALQLAGVAKGYPIRLGLARKPVLHDVSLELERGAALGLVGPNGSGKSTLIRILAGVERADTGHVRVLGGTPADEDVRRRVGYLPEDSPFPGELHATAALELFGALQGMRRADVRARSEEWLERVGLAEHARVPLRRYSRGMKRRFGLAQALLHGPDLLLLDEPSAGLDAPGLEVLEDVLAREMERGTSVVLCSHALEDLRSQTSRLALLLGGTVAAFGPTADVLGGGTARLVDLYRKHARP